MDDLWDIARVAGYLGVSERTVYNRVRSGDLPAVKVGRLWRVRVSDLEAWLAAGAAAAQGSGDQRGPYPFADATARLEVRESTPIPPRVELERLLGGTEDTLRRRLIFVGLLTQAVERLGWAAPIVVGGHAVEFYTDGDYPTLDIDLAGASEPIADVLAAWGFEREGRHWYDNTLNIVVEVPGGQLAPGQLEHAVSVRVAGLEVYVIGIEDLIVDRLAACVFSKHQESCDWAETLLKGASELDIEYLRRRAVEDNVIGRLEEMQAGI